MQSILLHFLRVCKMEPQVIPMTKKKPGRFNMDVNSLLNFQILRPKRNIPKHGAVKIQIIFERNGTYLIIMKSTKYFMKILMLHMPSEAFSNCNTRQWLYSMCYL